MLIYNITFLVEEQVRDSFLIWMRESCIPDMEREGFLKSPRLCHILSHREEGERYAMQWEVKDTATLHRWYSGHGARLSDDIARIFQHKVTEFPTLMEVIE